MTSLLNVGVSGLNAAMASMNTAGHNISNASTPGFTRQQVVQSAGAAISGGSGFLGQGAQVSTVQRVYSEFLTSQTSSARSRQSELDAYSTQISHIDGLLADTEAGLSPALQGFFSSVQGLASSPGSGSSSVPTRQAMLSGAQTLVSRFKSLDQMMNSERVSVNFQIQTSVSAISSYAKEVATLNGRIAQAEAMGMGQPANDLYDQRDQLLGQLSQEIGVTTTSNSDGSTNVFVGNGIPLVLGVEAYQVKAVQSLLEPDHLAVSLQGENSPAYVLPDRQLTGGKLGGLVSYMSETLDTAQNRLGQVAVSMAETFNTQHQLGQDLYGNQGQALFSLGAIPTTPNAANAQSTPAGLIDADFDSSNVSKLTSSDYKVTYDGSDFQVVRVSDQSLVGTMNAGVTSLSVDGLTFHYNSTLGSAGAGDSFLVQPTRTAASTLSMAITDPGMIAAGAMTRTSADVANTGRGQISAGTLNSADNLGSLFPAAPGKTTVTFGGGSLTFGNLPATAAIQITHADGSVNQYAAGTTVVPYVSGEKVTLAADFAATPAGDYSFEITGTVAAGDKFYLSRNTGATSDNANALAMGQLQTSNILNNGKTTFQGAYAQMVGVVGNTARDVSVNLSAQTTLVTQLETNHQSISGVNLDEMAANLIRYQQAYQAAGKLIQVSNTLFNQILNM